MRSAVRSFVALLLGSLLAGCATVPTAGVGDPDAVVAADSGLVAVQVVSNADGLGIGLRAWTDIFVRRIDDGALFRIPASDDGMHETRVFVGALAPGAYRIAALQAYEKISGYGYLGRALVPPAVGSFRIETRRLTNLGTLLYQPFPSQAEQAEDTKFLVSRLPDESDLSRFVQARFPDQVSTLADPIALGWAVDGNDDVRTLVNERVRLGAIASRAARTRQGDWLLLGRLGQIYHRDPAKRWHRISVGGPYQFLAFAELDDGTWLVGGERGVLYRSDVQHRYWQRLPFPSPEGFVVYLGQLPGGDLYAITQERGRFRFYRSDITGRGWLPEREFIREKPGFLFGVSYPFVAANPGGLRILMDGKEYTYSASERSFGVGPGIEFTRLHVQSDGVLVGRALETWAWTGESPAKFSRDGGHTWQQVAQGAGIVAGSSAVPHVASDGRIVMTASPTRVGWIKGLEFLAQVPVALSRDGGRTWSKQGVLERGCDRLNSTLSDDRNLVVVCADGRVLSSADDGKSWTHEFGLPLEWDQFPDALRGTRDPLTSPGASET